MKTRNTVFLMGATLVAALALAGCSNSSTQGGSGGVTSNAKDVAKSGFPIVKSPLKLTMFAPGSGTTDYSKMAVLNDYAKKTNVSFTYTTPPSADVATKLNLALASGDAPDVIYAASLTNAQAIQYGGSTLIDLKPYIDAGYLPNLKAILEKYPNVLKSMTTPDGKVYSLPFLDSKYDFKDQAFAEKAGMYQGQVWLNGAWLKKLNLEVPKTTDELFNTLTAFKNDDPNGNGKKDEIPLSSTAGGYYAVRNWVMNSFGVLNQEQQVDSKGKVTYGAIQSGYRDYLEYMNKLYTNGLLDNQTFTQSDDQKKAKGTNNLLGAYTDWFSYFTSNKTPDQAVNDPMGLPLTSPVSSKAQVIASDGVKTGAFAITTKCSNPAAALRWVDYFYSSAGSQYLNVGPEQADGGFWHYETNSKGEKVRVLNQGITASKSEEARAKVTPDYGTVPPKVNARPALVLANKDDAQTEDKFSQFIDSEMAKVKKDEVVAWPTLYMSSAQQTELGSTLENDLLTYATQMEAKFITGQTKLDDSSWNTYVSTLKKIGADKYIKVQQAAYDAYNKAK
ncbi:MAG: extracellular solute-binding protein [Streptococcaceae bacterium]|jgi:putative aldouronate transport system substrate-binding protein|nr:extracellular solute-binding protein [Streptococcaceae bacterium]